MTAVVDTEAKGSPLHSQLLGVGMSAGIRLAFSGISADELKKNSAWHNEATTTAQRPLAPCLVGSRQGDSLVREMAPQVMHHEYSNQIFGNGET